MQKNESRGATPGDDEAGKIILHRSPRSAEDTTDFLQRAEAQLWRSLEGASLARRMNRAELLGVEWEVRKCYLDEAVRSAIAAGDHASLAASFLGKALAALVGEALEREVGIDGRREVEGGAA